MERSVNSLDLGTVAQQTPKCRRRPTVRNMVYSPLPAALERRRWDGQDRSAEVLAIITRQPLPVAALGQQLGLNRNMMARLLQPLRQRQLVEGGSGADQRAPGVPDVVVLGPAFALRPEPECGEVLMDMVLSAVTSDCGHTRLSLCAATGLSGNSVQTALQRAVHLGALSRSYVGPLAIYRACPASGWRMDLSSGPRELSVLRAAADRLEAM